VYRAVIDRAHARGLRVAAHIFYLADAKDLLRAGVDFLAHSVRDADVDRELIDLMKARGVCLSPTLMREVSTFVYESRPAFFDDPFFRREADPAIMTALEAPERQKSVAASASAQAYKKALEVARRNLKALHDAGVRLAFGTDSGPPGRFQGYFEQLELEELVKSGLTPMQALSAATGTAAGCMGLAEAVGTLQPGRYADFVALSRNPLDDIRHTRTIESVWVAGNRVPPR
jgi:imidazolonepropionase-like amidohydrolase